MKKYQKMNGNSDFLSLGNLFDVIKSISQNKGNALQTELFCSLFNIKEINTTTVNNYCVGVRAISVEYKKLINDLKKKYETDKYVFVDIILSLVSIIEDYIYIKDDNSLDIINSNNKLKIICEKMLDIAKNDKHINNEFIDANTKLLNNSNLYEAFINIFVYTVLDNPQPLYIQKLDININQEELDDYLKVKLYEGFSYTNSLIELANKNNMYACADLGSMEFYGEISGSRNYNKSYYYYLKAADKGHPKACFMIANLIFSKKVKKDFNTLWHYLNKSIELGSSAGLNTMGLCYKYGVNPDNKVDIEKARHYFELASQDGYVFAYNNLGLLCKDEEAALNHFKISADLGDSWALNKVGEYYRQKGNLDKAYIYYKKSIESPKKERNKWGYYNLAKYYYDKGCKYENKDTYDEYMKQFTIL